MCHVCMVGVMVRGLKGLSGHWMACLFGSSLITAFLQMGERDCEDPMAQPSFGNGNSEEAGKAIPD